MDTAVEWGCTIKNMTIRESTENGVYVKDAKLTLENVRIYKSGSHGVAVVDTNAKVIDCNVSKSAASGLYVNNGTITVKGVKKVINHILLKTDKKRI